jgi:hypothetical protein
MAVKNRRTFSVLIHAEPGSGKSWLGQTAPVPRLTLDAEGGAQYAKCHGHMVPKVWWDPLEGPPPEWDGVWESCVVIVNSFKVLQRVFEWLNTTKHPFKSIVIDSLTEIQKRCKDVISGGETMTERNWGELLIKMEQLVRLQLRDLTFHPTNPIDTVVILALTDLRKGKYRPAVQGALGVSLPGYVDLEGFLISVHNDETDEQEFRLLIQPMKEYEVKDRTDDLTKHYGSVIINPDVSEMLAVLNEGEI